MTRKDAIKYAQQTANYEGRPCYAVHVHEGRRGWSFGLRRLKSYLNSIEVKPETPPHV